SGLAGCVGGNAGNPAVRAHAETRAIPRHHPSNRLRMSLPFAANRGAPAIPRSRPSRDRLRPATRASNTEARRFTEQRSESEQQRAVALEERCCARRQRVERGLSTPAG